MAVICWDAGYAGDHKIKNILCIFPGRIRAARRKHDSLDFKNFATLSIMRGMDYAIISFCEGI